MAASIARRSSFLRTIWTTTTTTNSSSRLSVSAPSVRSNFVFRHTRISPSRLLRRELSSLLPVHSAIASACLVSKIPSEASTSTDAMSWAWCILILTSGMLGARSHVDLPTISVPSSSEKFQ